MNSDAGTEAPPSCILCRDGTATLTIPSLTCICNQLESAIAPQMPLRNVEEQLEICSYADRMWCHFTSSEHSAFKESEMKTKAVPSSITSSLADQPIWASPGQQHPMSADPSIPEALLDCFSHGERRRLSGSSTSYESMWTSIAAMRQWKFAQGKWLRFVEVHSS